MATRQEVYQAIDSERDYQDHRWPAGTSCDRTVGEEILCMEDCLLGARGSWQSGKLNTLETLNHIRKVVAVGVRALENHGAPIRASQGAVSNG